MPSLNWGTIQDGGTFESLMHAILYAEDRATLLFGRPGRDAGQDARSSDGTIVYQAKYRQKLVMDGAVDLALEELKSIKDYRKPDHPNQRHWMNARQWVLVANFSINPDDETKWQSRVVPAYREEGLEAKYWHIETLEGKLSAHPEILDVFFGGENRVLVGLKEAHDLLIAACVGPESLDIPMVGRDHELQQIKDFANSDDKWVLPVVGPGGVGKSRLLYESLITLRQDGWRVLWGLPGEMSKSSQWSRSLNGSQKTFVAIDDPDDSSLLRRVIEQLSAIERKWRVIIACRNENAGAFLQFRNNRLVSETMPLIPLDEPASKSLMNICLKGKAEDHWLHSVFKFTGGNPGWMCLIAELTNRKALPELPNKIDDIASTYVESCLTSLNKKHQEHGRKLLRWLSLWGVLKVGIEDTKNVEFLFLKSLGIPANLSVDLLRGLVQKGLVRNWGVGRQLYAVEPLVVRQHILGDWLFVAGSDGYHVSAAGKRLVDQLTRGKIPSVDSVLKTLSHLVLSRLNDAETDSFLGPMFKAMEEIARNGTVLVQYRIADLIEKSGSAVPESSLNVLMTIRENYNDSMDVIVQPWGKQTYTHESLVANFPWILYQIAEHISDQVVARRFLEEFRFLLKLENAKKLHAEAGKGVHQLLKRILCESKNLEVFTRSAYDIAVEQLADPTAWPFVGALIESLLDPIRKSTNWTDDWTITFSKRAIHPERDEWNLAEKLRDKVLDSLREDRQPDVRAGLWHVLAKSHHEFHRVVLHGNVTEEADAPYQAVLEKDLETCAAILQSPPIPLTIEEATLAREMWSWYLEYGEEDSLRDLARKCEKLYDGISIWRLHGFYRFEEPEILRIADTLKSARNINVYEEFFSESERYLKSVGDGAEYGSLSALADSLVFLFRPDAPVNPLTSFVLKVLADGKRPVGSASSWTFSVRICERGLGRIKKDSSDALKILNYLRLISDKTPQKSDLLYGLYSNAHPAIVGELTEAELQFLLDFEAEFKEPARWFYLLGTFTSVNPGTVQESLAKKLYSLGNVETSSHCISSFIRALHISCIRYGDRFGPEIVECIIGTIVKHNLDGGLLGRHELEDISRRISYKMPLKFLIKLLRTRMDLDGKQKPYDDFKIVPHNFKVSTWCRFNTTNPAEVDDFHEFCHLALGNGFTALYWMPKYISQMDPSGQHVGAFVEKYIFENSVVDGDSLARLSYLASEYPDDSQAWAAIARPICVKTWALRREGREHVYFGLSRKETGVIRGARVDHCTQMRDRAVQLLSIEPKGSPLWPYREWALKCAEADLRRETERAEEDAHG